MNKRFSPQQAVDERKAYLKLQSIILIVLVPILFFIITASYAVIHKPEDADFARFLKLELFSIVALLFVTIFFLKSRAKMKFPILCSGCHNSVNLQKSRVEYKGKAMKTYFDFLCPKCGKEFYCSKSEYAK